MTEPEAEVDTASSAKVVDDNVAVSSETTNTTANDGHISALKMQDVLRGLERTEEGARDAEKLREWIRSMVAEGIEEDLNMKDSNGRTLLILSARGGLARAAKGLINAKATLDIQDDSGCSALHQACWRGHIEIVGDLLKNGASAKLLDDDKWSPLYMAVEGGHKKVTELLLAKHTWDLDLEESLESRTPLHAAVCERSTDIVRLLRGKGARLDLRDDRGRTPLMTAIDMEDTDTMTELLMQYDSKSEDLQLETEDPRRRSPLTRAAEHGFWSGVKILVNAGAKCDKSDPSKTRETGAVSVTTSETNTALHFAVLENNLEMVQYLLDHGANVNSRNHEGQQPLHLASVGKDRGDEEQSILYSETDSQIDEGTGGLKSESISTTYLELVRLLLERNADTKAEMEVSGKTAMELAFECGHDDRAKAIFDAFAKTDEENPDELFLWAAGKKERHWIATCLFEKQSNIPSDFSIAKISQGRSAIELAAGAKMPRVLWLLIASSPQNNDTKKALDSAKVIINEAKKQAGNLLTSSENQKRDRGDDTKKGSKSESISLDMQDIIDNPPTGLICTDSPSYNLPTYDTWLSSLRAYEAAMVRFYKRDGQVGNIIRSRNIEDTVYRQGPKKIMREVMEKYEEHSRGLGERIAKRPIFLESEPNFTWIHLPATNMVWMDHLVQRIMKDEEQPASSFNQVKSFFKDSWIQVPDNFSASRIMRPRFVSRDTSSRNTADDSTQTQDADNNHKRKSNDKKGEDSVEEGKEDAKEGDGPFGKTSIEQNPKKSKDQDAVTPAVAVTAIYMPYLSYSFQCAENTKMASPVTEQTSKSPKATEEPISPLTKQKAVEVRHKQLGNERKSEQTKDLKIEGEVDQGKEPRYDQVLEGLRKKYQKLLDEYDGNGTIIHGSSTLDESYYHFGQDLDSTEDRVRRNGTQVATESWLEERDGKERQPSVQEQEKTAKWRAHKKPGLNEHEQAGDERNQAQEMRKAEREQKLGSYWLLIRVNQLWIWTINDKWLISASSHPIDSGANELFQGILRRLEKLREAGGSDLQPGTTTEMSQLIIDYCVDYYEKKAKEHVGERPEECKLENFPSIRQTFSKSINSIARDETTLFEKFSSLTKELREILNDDTRDHSDAVKLMDIELAHATIEAEELSCRVKDILDELSILEATVQYQQDVQRAMKNSAARRAMIKQDVQKRIGKETVLETELTATYIINDIKGLESVAQRVHGAVNTTLSLQQSEIANLQAKLSIKHAELAAQQGRVLMVFTVVTILFLPLSFLTSLFALDVASFQQAPPWALGVIFSVSIAVFIPMVIFAFSWKRSIKFISDLLSLVPNKVMALVYYLVQLADISNRTRDDNGVAKSVPVRTESSRHGLPGRVIMATGALRVPRRPNDIIQDVEKGRSGGSGPTDQSNDHES